MSLIKTIREKLIKSIKDKNKTAKSEYSVLLSKLELAEKENKKELTIEQEYAIVSKEIKQLNESLESSIQANRKDLIEENKIKIDLLLNFVPKQLSDVEILDVIEETLSELNINVPKKSDKGLIMKHLMPKLKGKADGKKINKLLTNMLQ